MSKGTPCVNKGKVGDKGLIACLPGIPGFMNGLVRAKPSPGVKAVSESSYITGGYRH